MSRGPRSARQARAPGSLSQPSWPPSCSVATVPSGPRARMSRLRPPHAFPLRTLPVARPRPTAPPPARVPRGWDACRHPHPARPCHLSVAGPPGSQGWEEAHAPRHSAPESCFTPKRERVGLCAAAGPRLGTRAGDGVRQALCRVPGSCGCRLPTDSGSEAPRGQPGQQDAPKTPRPRPCLSQKSQRPWAPGGGAGTASWRRPAAGAGVPAPPRALPLCGCSSPHRRQRSLVAAPGSGCRWSWRGSRKEQCRRALRRNWKRQRERPEGTGIGPREPGPPRPPAEPGPPCPGLSQGWGAASAAGGAAQGARGPGGVSSLHRGPEWAGRAPRTPPSCPCVRGWEPGRAVGAQTSLREGGGSWPPSSLPFIHPVPTKARRPPSSR